MPSPVGHAQAASYWTSQEHLTHLTALLPEVRSPLGFCDPVLSPLHGLLLNNSCEGWLDGP